MSRYVDFEVTCLVDSIRLLGSNLGTGEDIDDHLGRVFSELAEVLRLLQLPLAADECVRVGELICVDATAYREEIEEKQEERDKLLKHHNVEDFEDLYAFVELPDGIKLEQAKEALEKLAENSA